MATIKILNGLSTLLLVTYTSSILAYLSYMQNELITYGTPTLPILNILLTLIILSSMILVISVVMIFRMFFKEAFYDPRYILVIQCAYYLITLVMFSNINNTIINNKDTSIENLNIIKYKKFLLNMSIGYFVICAMGLFYSFRQSKEIDKWKDSNKESKSKEKIRNSENISAKYNNEKCQKDLTASKQETTLIKAKLESSLKDAIDEATYASQIRSGSGGMFGVPIQNQYQPSISGGPDTSPEARSGEIKKRRLGLL